MIRRQFLIGTLATMIAADAASAQQAGKFRALIIANSYVNAPGDLALPNTIADGRLIAKTLGVLKFAGTKLVEDPDEAGLLAELSQFSKRLAPHDLAMVYIAGHGVQIENENFLLLADGKTFTSLSSIITAVRAATDTVILFLDACRNNPFQQSQSAASVSRSVKIRRAVDAAHLAEDAGVSFKNVEGQALGRIGAFGIQGTGVKIVFSTDPTNVALDSVSIIDANSPFATSLARRLRERKSLDDVVSLTTGDVVSVTGGDQSPWSQGSIGKPIFVAGPPLDKNPARPRFQVPG